MKALLKISSFFFFSILFFQACEHDPIEPEPEPIASSSGGCNPNTVYFQNEILPLIRSNCAIDGCHDQISAANGVILTDYNNIMNTADIEKGQPEESKLFKRITKTDPDKVMPPSPYTPLSYNEIDRIRRWIEQGAENNRCNDCDTTQFTFSGSILHLIQSHCTGCHSGPAANKGILLTNYSEIKSKADNGQLMGTISHTSGTAMPYNLPKLSDCKITQVRKWIEAGALNN